MDAFTVVLDSQLTNDVTVGVSSTGTGEGTVSSNMLAFTGADWNIPSTVTVGIPRVEGAGSP